MLPRGPRKRELLGEPQSNQPPPKKGRHVERRFKKRKIQEVLDELCVHVESNDRQLTNNIIRELDTEHVRVISDEDFTANCTQILKACLSAKLETVSNKTFGCLVAMFARGSPESRREFVLSLEDQCEGLARATREAARMHAVLAEESFSSTTSSTSSVVSSKEIFKKKKTSVNSSKKESAGTDADEESSTDESELGYDPIRIKKRLKKMKIKSGEPRDSKSPEDDLMEEVEEISMVDAFFLKPNLDVGVLSIYTQALREGLIEAEQVPEKIMLCARRSLAQSSLATTANRIAGLEFHVALEIARFLVYKPPDPPTQGPNQYTQFVKSEGEWVLINFCMDRDFRVRKSVVEGLLELSENFRIAKSTYFTAKAFINDTDPDIRIAAIRLLMFFARTIGDEFMPQPMMMDMDEFEEEGVYSEEEGSSPRLPKPPRRPPPKTYSDDAFVAICDAINDIEIAVRVEAAKKLGDFITVSEDLIYQTLDKKMMKTDKNKQVVRVEQSLFALSKKASANKNSRWKFAKKPVKMQETRGGWSRGKELNAVCPDEEAAKKEEEEEGESIIPHGACGVFVTALEDEFMDVRKAAVYSLGRLACTRPAFAVSALEYLADMFNDEIADVRLDAINALTPLISHGTMNTEQLNVISKCLDDAMPESRQAMRELLKRAQFADVECVEMCVKALLACLKRFPKDKEQVYSCLAVIGRNHAVQVQSIMRSLLGIHLIFHTREISIEDQEYVGKLIMVLNAAASQPSLVYFMPEFVHRHYRLLRHSYPGIVKGIRVLDEEKQIGKVKNGEDLTNEKAEDVVLNTYKRLCAISTISMHNERNIKRDDIFRDTSAISLYNSSVSGAARLIFCLGEVSSTVDSVSNTVLQGGELTNVKQLITSSIEDMKSVEHQFSGISLQIHSYLIHCRFYLSFLDLLVWMMQSMTSQQELIAAGQALIQETKTAIENCEEKVPESESLLEFVASCESIFFATTATDDKRKIITPNTLIELLGRSAPSLPNKFPPVNTIHLKYANITTPNKDTAVEECLKFYAHLPHGMPLEFDLYNMLPEELESVRIKTIHPDSRFDVMKPRKEEFKEENGHVAVSTQVKITSASPWSDPAEIDVVIGILSDNKFVPLFASPSCFSPAHIRVRIHPHSR
ncbi:hypothetical protein CAEBREN_31156 [Caenorhabditis brenneri]|uniref:Integrator complex subunit 4/Protein SIEL C-terminal Ig-like domain-containing protein n=1 Tax=Caenorhabditis brenneri TaxID=135651 RepID=G0NPH0_CAEBE|nr:hypothetical protein CAEBREN_31156 [Caenorhabditis brenneri]